MLNPFSFSFIKFLKLLLNSSFTINFILFSSNESKYFAIFSHSFISFNNFISFINSFSSIKFNSLIATNFLSLIDNALFIPFSNGFCK